ncbi:hypothetical protein [Campylobacter sp. CNRCH_2015_0338h]|uniref:hypothetical protein n=1 Tax=Campylobacter sp. CNRCH_2015_0338h TaxID=2911605 RepID=UPI0013B686FA|nr:hypothetical protein [Campylobacter sp. CNRCH_2015_0338h]EAI5466738.1 hypothetical protein [Campylobacter lari]EDP6875174.1 hypothetical protein [Campylobacter lari]MCV3471813.1 hypothetical protein [Campylobacter sp. CNRCH_2015_0338h]
MNTLTINTNNTTNFKNITDNIPNIIEIILDIIKTMPDIIKTMPDIIKTLLYLFKSAGMEYSNQPDISLEIVQYQDVYFIDTKTNNIANELAIYTDTEKYFLLEKYKDILCELIHKIYIVSYNQEAKEIDYEKELQQTYKFYFTKFKKNSIIEQPEKELLFEYRDAIDKIKNYILEAKPNSLNFFYSAYALNELFGCYIDDYLELLDYLCINEDLVKLGKNFYMENKKFNVL